MNFNEEGKLWKRGVTLVAGLDEAGRGPLAGPVVAAAVVYNSLRKHSDILQNVRMFSGIRDSKKLSAKQREYFYQQLTNHKNIAFGVGIVSEKVIDKVNILEATKLAMNKALAQLGQKPQFLLLDGNFTIPSGIAQKSIIRGDNKVFSIAAAGIIAKVTRDSMMQKLHKKYPNYGFDVHKGYGTKLHLKNLQTFGPCKIHRKTFWPVRSIAKIQII